MNIALVAHDGRKKELLEWVSFNAGFLSRHNLYATGTTGKIIGEVQYSYKEFGGSISAIIEHEANLSENMTCLLSGPLGGDAQIGAMIAEGKIDMLIFFCDHLITQGHQQDVGALSRLASLYNIPYATNRTTADMLITSPLFNNPEYKRIIPTALEHYANRKL